MNKRKFLFAFLVSAFVFANAHEGQPRFNFGISANIGSNYHHYTAGAVDGKTTTSFGAGLLTQLNFGFFAIRPEVHYDRIRGRHPNGLIATNNITVPLSLVFQTIDHSMGFPIGSDIFIGGFYSHRFSGTQGGDPLNFGDVVYTPDAMYPLRETFHRDEFGITWGLGIRIGPVMFGYTNRTALTDFTQQTSDIGGRPAHIRNRTNYFTMTFMF